MKLQNIYVEVKKCYDEVRAVKNVNEKMIGKFFREKGDQIIRIDNYYMDIFMEAEYSVQKLSGIECLQKDAKLFLHRIPSNSRGGATSPGIERFNSATVQLLNKMECIIDFCESLGVDSEKIIGIDVKMPKCEDLTELKKNISELEFIITKCPFLQDEKEVLKFKNIDIGSTWLTFAIIGGSIATGSILLNNIAAFVDKCMVIRSHYLTIKKQKDDLEEENIEKAEKETILKYLDRLYKTQVDNVTKEMEELSGYTLEDEEEKGRAEQSFEKMGKLMDKGLQIYSTIDTPEETKALFKPLEMHYLEISDKLKLIEKKDDSEEDS